MILAWQWIKILVKKKLKSIYFKVKWFYDFYALVTALLWKQIDAPVGFGCKLYIYTLLNKIESTLRKIKVSVVFEMIDSQWDFNAIFVVPFSHYFNPWKCQRTWYTMYHEKGLHN